MQDLLYYLFSIFHHLLLLLQRAYKRAIKWLHFVWSAGTQEVENYIGQINNILVFPQPKCLIFVTFPLYFIADQSVVYKR